MTSIYQYTGILIYSSELIYLSQRNTLGYISRLAYEYILGK